MGYRIPAAPETPLELWHAIYDAAVEEGRDPATAAQWADERYWPGGVHCPDAEVRAQCSTYRDPAKRITR